MTIDDREDESLEDSVEEALERSGASFRHETDSDLSEIRLYATDKYNSSTEVKDFEVFEALFNPVTGALSDFPDDLSYRVRIKKTLDAVYEAHTGTELIGFDAEEIEELQEAATEESFAKGYSKQKFRELYESRA